MNGRENCGIKKRFHRHCVSKSDLSRRDMTSGAAFQEWFLERKITFRESDKQAVIQFQKVRHDLTQDKIFVDALDGRFPVCHTIATARMQQTMVAAGGAKCDFAAFDDGDV